MISPVVLIWISVIVFLLLVLLVLLEIYHSQQRREKEEMFGTKDFEEKENLFGLTEKERHTIEKLVRQSSFSNKDAVFNSSILFEKAVNRFYEFRNINQIREETLSSVSSLREKLLFTINHPHCILSSSRQLVLGAKVSLDYPLRDNKENMINWPPKKEHVEITGINEKNWTVKCTGVWNDRNGVDNYKTLVDSFITMNWTQPEEAVYSGIVKVLKVSSLELTLSHSIELEKVQLRRWIREQVLFPVEVTLPDSSKKEGFLFDLSAGGILIGLPINDMKKQEIVDIQFDLPGFGQESAKIELKPKLNKKRQDFPDLYLYPASFSGDFGRIQEKVLQYIFEVQKKKKTKNFS